MLVREIMEKNILTVTRGTTLRQLLEKFKDFHTFPVVPVVNNNGVLGGVVYLHNLVELFKPYHLEILANNPLLDRQEVDIFNLEIEEGMGDLIIMDDIMDKRFVKVKETDNLESAYNLMKLHSLEDITVVDFHDRVIGIIGIFDIIVEVFRSKGLLK
jgi:CBS domain-containing protein